MKIKAKISFSGAVSMRQGEERELADEGTALQDLLEAGYVVGVDIAHGASLSADAMSAEIAARIAQAFAEISPPMALESVELSPSASVIPEEISSGTAQGSAGENHMADNIAYVQALAEKAIAYKQKKAAKAGEK